MQELFLRSKFLTSKTETRGGRQYLPYVFTEQGVYMLMTVLKGDLATRQSKALVRAFKEMKDFIVDNRSLIGQSELLLLSVQTTQNTADIAEIKANMVTKADLAKVVHDFTDHNYSLQHYNVYRSYDNTDYQQIATVPAIEGQQYYQYRDVLVGEAHSSFYYKLTAVYLSDENEECESDYAASLVHPDWDYVMVDDAWDIPGNQTEAVELYPNPTEGRLTIRAQGMRQVSLFNALGQRVQTLQVDADSLTLDVSSCGSGVYLLQITTQSRTFTRWLVVSL
jgi:hypothetical protein